MAQSRAATKDKKLRISNQKRASKASVTPEIVPEIFRAIVDNVPQNLYCTDLLGRVIFANRQYCKSLKLPLNKILGKTAYDFFPKELADKYAKDDRKVVRSGKTLQIEEWNKPPTREAMLVRVIKSPLRDKRGKIIGVQGTYWDVTAEHKAAEKMAEQAYFLNTLMNNMPDNIYFKDRKSRFLRVSRTMAKHLGAGTPDVAVGKIDSDFFTPEHAKPALEDDQHVMRTGQPIVAKEEKETFPNGKVMWVSTTKVPLRDNNGHIVGTFGVSRDITDRKRAEDLLYRRAFYDPLTDLPNRALFMDRLSQMYRRSRRNPDKHFAVLFLDLDRFKSVNDSLGHAAGDTMLIAAARRLEACVRPGDTVARLGGDEFTVLLEEIRGVNDAVRVAERIIQSLSAPIPVAKTEVFASASVGIAMNNSKYQQPDEILRDADTAMYGAKSHGKGRYEIFKQAMHETAVIMLDNETRLRRALEKKEFRVFYQPIIGLTENRIIGFEALIRWQHPTRGLLLPDQFLPQAEEFGVIGPIGLWVLEEACKQTRDWNERYKSDPPLKISVNLSSSQLAQRGFVDQVKEVLKRTKLDPACLSLEITERTLIENLKSTATMLAELRNMAVKVNIDDFGTGYSMLQHLRHYPADTLKVDGSFVKMIEKEEVHIEVLRTITRLAKALGMNITAEGIESETQLETLRKVDCKTAQGYLFSKPVDASAATKLLKSGKDWQQNQ